MARELENLCLQMATAEKRARAPATTANTNPGAASISKRHCRIQTTTQQWECLPMGGSNKMVDETLKLAYGDNFDFIKDKRIETLSGTGAYRIFADFQSAFILILRSIFHSQPGLNNDDIRRRILWRNLTIHKRVVGIHPWVIMGNFNASLSIEDSSTGSSRFTIAMREFKECVDSIEVMDVNQTGMRFTWNQRPNEETGILKKLDRVMANEAFSNGNLHDRVVNLRSELDAAQTSLDSNPYSIEIREDESHLLKAFNDALLDEERFIKQKSKIEWLCVGDCDSSYFHKVVKAKTIRNRIHSVEGLHGGIVEGRHVASVFVQHYENCFGCSSLVESISNPNSLFSNKINPKKANFMIRSVTHLEVKEAMFSIGENKSPGSDGYTSAFFKCSWDIVGNEVTQAVQDIFKNGQLLRELNHTIISLVPKVQVPGKVTDYRPISSCNIIFKCISKIITNRIKDSLHDIISENQSAFISGRRISDNILLTQEIMKNYHLSRGPPYVMVKWIMKCVSTASFSINVNGSLHSYFKGKRGLRQGDPLSPYLFTMVMEVLTLMLKRNIRREEAFQFHPKCERQEIINVCFADDLFMFSYANFDSVKVISDALQEFKNYSGLVPSLPKSTAFFANVDCKILVQKVKNKIDDWKNKSLSFAGRIQLVASWKDMEGNLLKFSVAQAWKAIRPRATEAWEVANSVSLEDMKYPLCNLIRDSHSHLFFECGISLQVWQRVKVLFHIPDIGNSWRSIVDTIQSSAHKKLA
ncbi:uncharacterized protein Tco_0980356 [Tanacetum coccineum]